MSAPTTEDLAVDTIANQIAAAIHAALWAHNRLMGLDDAASWDPDTVAIDSAALRLAFQLLGNDERDITPDQVAAAQTIMSALWTDQGPPPEWWDSPLGLAVARANRAA